jgi:hypothetical protein
MEEVGVVEGVAEGAVMVGVEVGIKKVVVEATKDRNNQGKPLFSLLVLPRGRVGVQPLR